MKIIRVCFFIVLVFSSCQKEGDDMTPSTDGRYISTATEGQHTGTGVVTITSPFMDLSIPGVINRKGVQFNTSGSTIGFPVQSWGGHDNWRIIGGSGTLSDGQLQATIKIMRWESSLFVVHVTGSK